MRFFLLVISLSFFSKAFSQDPVVSNLRKEINKSVKKEADTSTWRWKKGGLINFSLAQGSLSNWAAGGDNFSLAISSYFNRYWLHKKDRNSWDNSLDVNLGFVQTTSLGGRKNDDRVDFLSKYGYQMDSVGKWYLSALFNFRSQFFDGYTYSQNVGTFSSTILAPAYVVVSIGFDYKPTDRFSLFISPITSRTIIVANRALSKIASYGVDSGRMVKNELGAFGTINYTNPISSNVTYKGRVDLFSNYQNRAHNIDIFMTNQFSFKINKYFSATYSLDLIYDDDVRIFGKNGSSAALQSKSLIGIGFLKALNVKKTGNRNSLSIK
ncbi:MAG: DUF3078 domain-containing protein [Chitinophagaceae bacterium]